MELMPEGIEQMLDWVRDRRPECLPENPMVKDLFPHDMKDEQGRDLTGNELLVELAGRKCYDSFGLKAGRKSNAAYIANTQDGDIPHASIMYHAKFSFFIGGVSRRVSHELIRHYVGADRDEEGSPSQESTRYVEHAGRYIAHPTVIDEQEELHNFMADMNHNYIRYRQYIDRRSAAHKAIHNEDPKGMARKRIFESASSFLSHSCETSFIWTTNPIALAKMLRERHNLAADREYQRLAGIWKKVALQTWPNLWPQAWMKAE